MPIKTTKTIKSDIEIEFYGGKIIQKQKVENFFLEFFLIIYLFVSNGKIFKVLYGKKFHLIKYHEIWHILLSKERL